MQRALNIFKNDFHHISKSFLVKLYKAFYRNNMNDSKIIFNINKSIEKHSPKLTIKDHFSVIYSNYLINSNLNTTFLKTLLSHFLYKDGAQSLNIKASIKFLKFLSDYDFIENKDLIIDQTLSKIYKFYGKQLNNLQNNKEENLIQTLNAFPEFVSVCLRMDKKCVVLLDICKRIIDCEAQFNPLYYVHIIDSAFNFKELIDSQEFESIITFSLQKAENSLSISKVLFVYLKN